MHRSILRQWKSSRMQLTQNALEGDKSIGQALAAEKSAKAAKGELLCVT